MGLCNVCKEPVADQELLDHLRLLHPSEYGDGPNRWPDGGLVFIDKTAETPEDL